MTPVALVTEDELSEAVGVRLLSEGAGRIGVGLLLRKGGNGYIRSWLENFCQMASQGPVLIITDMDTWTCPAALCSEWFRRKPRPSGLLLRVAVREVEAWLLADHDGLRGLLGERAAAKFPAQPETLADPKQFLLSLAARAPRQVRDDLCADSGAVARQGLGYNARLTQFVREVWSPKRAASHSRSLRRARERIGELAKQETGHR